MDIQHKDFTAETQRRRGLFSLRLVFSTAEALRRKKIYKIYFLFFLCISPPPRFTFFFHHKATMTQRINMILFFLVFLRAFVPQRFILIFLCVSAPPRFIPFSPCHDYAR